MQTDSWDFFLDLIMLLHCLRSLTCPPWLKFFYFSPFLMMIPSATCCYKLKWMLVLWNVVMVKGLKGQLWNHGMNLSYKFENKPLSSCIMKNIYKGPIEIWYTFLLGGKILSKLWGLNVNHVNSSKGFLWDFSNIFTHHTLNKVKLIYIFKVKVSP